LVKTGQFNYYLYFHHSPPLTIGLSPSDEDHVAAFGADVSRARSWFELYRSPDSAARSGIGASGPCSPPFASFYGGSTTRALR